MFHPVTTEIQNMKQYANNFVEALQSDNNNYVIVFPNNDLGSTTILKSYEILKNNPRFRIIPSLRFEYFLTLLKNAKFLIGNSSSGIHEAPYLGIPVINVGTRQNNRSSNSDIINVDYNQNSILESINSIKNLKIKPLQINTKQANSAQKFLESLESEKIWTLNHQKQFRDL
jgi:UDP-N-acetylglucosamine 2-epimerase (hydrolysing)